MSQRAETGSSTAAVAFQAKWKKRFKGAEDRAHVAKTLIQMTIGVFIALVLLVKAGFRSASILGVTLPSLSHTSDVLLSLPTLTIVGRGLAYSAGLDLALMLFTPGPDEAIEPVIVGLAASILITISDEKVDWADAVVVPVACLSIGFLLLLKRVFAKELSGGHSGGQLAKPLENGEQGNPNG